MVHHGQIELINIANTIECTFAPQFPRWYAPELHREELTTWMRDMMKTPGLQYDCLDVFGFSQRVSKMWRRYGFHSISFDIKLDHKRHDI